jgi:tape measure domain-containing protein
MIFMSPSIPTENAALRAMGVHFSDCLGAANEALHAGAVTREQWRKLVEAMVPLWDAYAEVAGHTVEEAVKSYIERFMTAREKHTGGRVEK